MTNEKKGMREVMPETAKLVDELRAQFGAEVIDLAIAAGQRARREYAAQEATNGRQAAQAWLRRQRFPAGSFWASEGGNEVGVKRT